MADSGENWIIVAAFDFGTTYSGYAFSMRDKPMDIQSPQTWYAGTTQLASLKTPTCLLLNADASFNSFGFEAQNKYATFASMEKHKEYYYFEKFKMILHHNEKITRQTPLEDIDGKSLPAISVFSWSIWYLKDHLMKTLNDRVPGIDLSDVKIVLTVPAIWHESSKQLMREAAVQAGIDTRQIVLAYEPEAASLYCQRIPVDKFSCGQDFQIVDVGTQYLVADIGGGTADFSVHEKEPGGKLKALHKASGGPHGGIYVDKNYKKIFQNIFGNDALESLKTEDMADYLDIFRDFETKKRTVVKNYTGVYIVRIPAILAEIAKRNGRNLKEIGGKLEIMRDKLRIDGSIMEGFFDESINSILYHIRDILLKFPKIKNIILVGGYGECSILQQNCKDMFGEKNLIIPNECGLAVVRGAVLYGHFSSTVSSRIMKYTYGVNHSLHFIPGKHPEDRKYISEDGKARCSGTFKKLIECGTSVPASGKIVSTTTFPKSSSIRKFRNTLYYTEEKDPMFYDDENCKSLGSIFVTVPEYKGVNRRVREEFIFGMTEIKVSATVLETGEKIEATFDLLE